MVEINAGGLITKPRNTAAKYIADWDREALAAGVTLAAPGTFTISPNDGALTITSEALLAGNRSVQFTVGGGRSGRRYRITHRVMTAETPAETKEQSFFLLVQDS